ncbi:PREDICTED: transcriptional adapter 2-beta-like [Amphimedon queenslandica]|uniref:Transcriptional adapter n=1 Tax=Amphimedon queenslandica TaxID=400682 RepID=A0AAN0J7S7_AMPQE|nr:PREDICTED: transcriptional adapter 2-beta-like [Amphimedon queenslandica]|eukprot:XP_019853085.1 PREDICTED: transcriptional adapter 2-beta-like [Amphimedon queenslandica]
MADDDSQRYHCSYCGCDITLRLKCNGCPDFDLCLECFASGASIGNHMPDHPYQLIDEGSFPLLTNDWGAIEEVLLLEAVEQDGFGNWEDIGAHVFTKTARESKDHYNEAYVNSIIGEGLLLPDYHSKVLADGGGEIPPSPPSFTPMSLEHNEQQDLTYAPLRDDFEKEYDNGAERIISEVPIHNEEDSIERELKLAHIDMYNKRLGEREKRKCFARDHNLLGGKMRISSMKRKYSKEERDIRNKFRPLARLMDKDEYEKLVGSLKREKELIERIQSLKEYKRNGITKIEDGIEIDMLKQEKEKENEHSELPGDTYQGIALLTQKERKMCHSLGLQTQEYLNIKTEILKAAGLRLKGIPAKPSLPKSLPRNTKCHIIKYLHKAGLIS